MGADHTKNARSRVVAGVGGTEVGWQMMQILEDSRHVQMAGDRFLVSGSKEHGSSV